MSTVGRLLLLRHSALGGQPPSQGAHYDEGVFLLTWWEVLIEAKELMVLRVRHTPTRFPSNILSTPVGRGQGCWRCCCLGIAP